MLSYIYYFLRFHWWKQQVKWKKQWKEFREWTSPKTYTSKYWEIVRKQSKMRNDRGVNEVMAQRVGNIIDKKPVSWKEVFRVIYINS